MLSETVYLCPSCSAANSNHGAPPRGVLKTIYDYDAIRETASGFDGLKKNGFHRPPSACQHSLAAAAEGGQHSSVSCQLSLTARNSLQPLP
ncbi:MAG: hypothetical protein MZV63_49165 [Marinilabiliales bacterium]|nr:hypothetical protein [Marinilabiliales bacterium]